MSVLFAVVVVPLVVSTGGLQVVLVTVVTVLALLGTIATCGLVIRTLRDLRPTDNPALRRRIAHQMRLPALLAVAGSAVTFAAYAVLLHLLGIADHGTSGYFLFFAVFTLCISPLLFIAARYGVARRDG